MSFFRAMGLEVRRTFEMTWADAKKFPRSGKGWMADPHLLFGWFCGTPIFLGGIVIASQFKPYTELIGFAGAVLANLVWFAVAAYRRAGKAPNR
ncbi:hypothetical protein BH11ARM2_BH11ARM2_29470 [soil metagenome]